MRRLTNFCKEYRIVWLVAGGSSAAQMLGPQANTWGIRIMFAICAVTWITMGFIGSRAQHKEVNDLVAKIRSRGRRYVLSPCGNFYVPEQQTITVTGKPLPTVNITYPK